MSELSPILQVAKDILSEIRKEMHVNDIAKAAVAKHKNLGLSEEELAKKLSAAMSANLSTKKPIFSKPSNGNGGQRRGVYKLRKSATAPVVQVIKISPPPANTLFTGKAGEYAVASELLFWGFNVSIMAVDQGVDLIVEKSGKFRHIQVKTAVSNDKEKPFAFKIEQKVFDACQQLSPWYVFAMREGVHTDYAVIPSSHLLHLRATGIISGRDLSFQISRDEKRKQYKLNNSHDINMYINNFGLI